jgi:hypothetical protein
VTVKVEITDELPRDEPAPTAFDHTCACGAEIVYHGRGRPPVKCEGCKTGDKSSRARGETVKKRGSGSNANLARQAADTLALVNNLAATGLMLAPGALSLPRTASALAGANDGFTEAAYEALLSDPSLARAIMRGGGVSGKFALVIAYAMLAGAVVPVAMEEVKARRKGDDVSDRTA